MHMKQKFSHKPDIPLHRQRQRLPHVQRTATRHMNTVQSVTTQHTKQIMQQVIATANGQQNSLQPVSQQVHSDIMNAQYVTSTLMLIRMFLLTLQLKLIPIITQNSTRQMQQMQSVKVTVILTTGPVKAVSRFTVMKAQSLKLQWPTLLFLSLDMLMQIRITYVTMAVEYTRVSIRIQKLIMTTYVTTVAKRFLRTVRMPKMTEIILVIFAESLMLQLMIGQMQPVLQLRPVRNVMLQRVTHSDTAGVIGELPPLPHVKQTVKREEIVTYAMHMKQTFSKRQVMIMI